MKEWGRLVDEYESLSREQQEAVVEGLFHCAATLHCSPYRLAADFVWNLAEATKAGLKKHSESSSPVLSADSRPTMSLRVGSRKNR